jgi:hypothetical protein
MHDSATHGDALHDGAKAKSASRSAQGPCVVNRLLVLAAFLGLLAGCAARVEVGDVVHAGGKLFYDTFKAARESERRPHFD